MSTAFKSSFLLLVGILLVGSGCATTAPEYIGPPEEIPESRSPVPRQEQDRDDRAEKLTPQTVASLRLSEQARLLLESKRPDEAIRLLERAVNIDPGNGQNYYYLAEAWLLKKNRMQALEFNRISQIHLNHDTAWMSKVRQQRQRIENAGGRL